MVVAVAVAIVVAAVVPVSFAHAITCSRFFVAFSDNFIAFIAVVVIVSVIMIAVFVVGVVAFGVVVIGVLVSPFFLQESQAKNNISRGPRGFRRPVSRYSSVVYKRRRQFFW